MKASTKKRRSPPRGAGHAQKGFSVDHEWLWGLGLFLAVILAYSPVWWAGYVWDDDVVVTGNPVIVGPLGLKEIWTTSAADVCPMVLTTFWLEHALWGLDLRLYHVVNVLMHGACAVLLWRVLRRLQIPGAWLGAALWALHPVEAESVAWITEMKNTESGVFFLLAVLFFMKWLKVGDGNKRNGEGWFYAWALIFAALAMASKSSTVVLPAVFCLCAWWIEGRWHWRNLLTMAPVVFMSIAASAVSIWTVTILGAVVDTQWARTWPERLAAAGDAVWFYLGKLVWPYPLIAVYPRWQIDSSQWFSYLPLLAVIVVLFILWLKRDSWLRPCFFAFAYFLAALIPVLGLVDNYIFRYSLVFDHFQYLASMGPLALAGAGFVRGAQWVIPERASLQSILAAGVLSLLGLLSWQRAWAYQNEQTLWTDALSKNPDCWVGYNNLGWDLFQRGDLDGAIDQYQKALAIYPAYAEGNNDLGFALYEQGRVDDAIEKYQTALEINPNYAEAYSNLGNALVRKGELDEALVLYQKALDRNPNLANAHYNFGNALMAKGRVSEALAQYVKALEDNPNLASAHSNYAIALAKAGRLDQAIDEFQKAVEINPNSASAHNNLGFALMQKGEAGEAVTEFEEALRLDPNMISAQSNLTRAQAAAGEAPAPK